jgi:hypothetical protein
MEGKMLFDTSPALFAGYMIDLILTISKGHSEAKAGHHVSR